MRARLALLAVIAILWAESSISGEAEVTTPPSDLLTFRYVKPASPEFDELSATLRESRILEVWTTYVNARLRGLPIKLEVAVSECGRADSLYEPLEGVITLCYEEIHRVYVTLNSLRYDSDRLLVAWIGTMLSELYHELAHALIHKLMLPIAGREEDAADQFAVLALLKHPRGEDLALGSADYFQDIARLEQEAGPDPSQRHPLYAQRYFNTLCLIYGSDPVTHSLLVEQQRLPEARAKTCRVEYARAAYAWDALLEPYTK